MKKRLTGIRILPAIAISLSLLAFPAYLRGTRPSGMKFVSADLSFENSDQKEGLAEHDTEWKGYGLQILLVMFLLGAMLFEHSCFLFPPVLSFHQTLVVLRC